MDRKAIFRVGFVTVFVLILAIGVFLVGSSSAVVERDVYELGENVKVNLGGVEDYRVKISTPSENYVMEGSRDSFVFRPEEVGKYKLELEYQENKEVFEFEVVSGDEELEKEVEEILNEIGNESEETSHTADIREDFAEEAGDFEPDEGAVQIGEIKVNEPVRWVVRKSVLEGEDVRVNVPVQAKEVVVYEVLGESRREVEVEIEQDIIGNVVSRVLSFNQDHGDKEIVLGKVREDVNLEVEFYTEPAIVREKIISNKRKEVVVSSPSGLDYTNVRAFTSIPELVRDSRLLRIYWKEESRYLGFEAKDTDGDGLLDFVEWVVPHLSEQTFEIILIEKAEHLDSNREVLENVFDKVKARDGNWAEIPEGDYLRVVFEKPLVSRNDITIYARPVNGVPDVEIYEKDSSRKLADYGGIKYNGRFKVYLDELEGEQDTFDLKVVGGDVEFDYVVDPPTVWWNTTWKKRKEINFTGVGSFTDFPAYFNVSYDSDMQADYDDLRFINGSCNSGETLELDYEVENYTSSSAHTWVRIPNVYSGVNQICMYYDNDNAGNGENVSGVWSNNYVMVHHMNDYTPTTLLDSTSNDNNGTKRSSTQPTQVSGPIGNAQDFNTNSWIDIPLSWSGGPVTFEFWNYVAESEKADSWVFTASVDRMSSHAPWSNNNIYFDYGPGCCGDRIDVGYSSYYDSWTYIGLTSEGDTGSQEMQIFFNGRQVDSNNNGDDVNSVTNFRIGARQDDIAPHPGSVDEFRMSSVVRSDAWMNQTYQMMANQDDIVVFDDEVGGYGDLIVTLIDPSSNEKVVQNEFFNFTAQVICSGGVCGDVNLTLDPISPDWWNVSWGLRKEINISSVASSNLSNFPIYLNISKESEMQEDFEDLRFINGSCSSLDTLELSYEIENYTGYNAHVWVGIPELALGTTSICMYYNNTNAGNGEDATGVWDDYYLAVYHYSDTLTGAAGDLEDSTANSNDGRSFNMDASDSIEGITGGGFDFTNSDSQYLQLPDITDGNAQITVEYWVKDPDYDDNRAFSNGGDDTDGLLIWPDDGNGLDFLLDGSGNRAHNGNDGWTGWVLHGATYDGSTMRNYENGMAAGTDTFSGNIPDDNSVDWFGRDASGQYFDDPADELRISSIARSADWMNMSYQVVANQDDLVDFGEGEGPSFIKGVVSMTVGDLPFYTTTQNPNSYTSTSCLGDMQEDENCSVTWEVNATGDMDSVWEFYVYAESTNYSSRISMTESDRINITIYGGEQATVNEIQCEQGGTFKDCSEVDYGETLTRVRVNCTYTEGSITNAKFNFTGVADGYNYFYADADSSSGDWWIYDNANIQISDSGELRIDVQCFDDIGKNDTGFTNWTVPWGNLVADLLFPREDRNVAQYRFFDFNASVSCVGGECGNVNATLDPPNWWGDGWQYRQDINITSVVSSSLTDFPIYLNVSHDSAMQSNYDDLRFVSGNCVGGGSEIPYEIENYTDSNAYVWVGIPSLSSGLNQICMYYGNAGASSGENVTGVWSNGYLAVYHYEDVLDGSAGDLSDSTGSNDGRSFNMGSNDRVSGIGGGNAYDFTESESEYLQLPDLADGRTQITVEYWIKDTDYGDGRAYSSGGNDGSQLMLWPDETNGLDMIFSGNRANNGIDNHAGWAYHAGTYDGSTMRAYENGNPAGTSSFVASVPDGGSVDYFGRDSSGDYLDDTADELRLSSTPRSGDWINMSYQIVANQDNLVRFGEVEQSKGGAVSMVVGQTPFYTVSQNPRDYLNRSCLTDMRGGDSCNITWSVNSTGLLGQTFEFFVKLISTNYSSYVSESRSGGVNLTIAANLNVLVENVQCEEGGSWRDCNEIDFSENLTRVSAECNSQEGSTVNATFELKNLDESITYFKENATSNVGNQWIFDNSDLIINESGEYQLWVDCYDDIPTNDSGVVNWDVDFGALTVTLVNPSESTNVNPGEFFDFTARINCVGGECGNVNATLDPPNWWDGDFIYRKDIDLLSYAALTDFPVYLNVSYESGMQTDYDDLRFVSGSCAGGAATPLSYEIADYDSNSAEVWVKIPSFSSGTNEICMYYGNVNTDGGENVTDVWSNDYVMVFHMDEYNSTYLIDSVGNYNGTKRSSTQPSEISGPVAGAQDFDGDSWIDIPLIWEGGPVTFEFWNYVAEAETQNSRVFSANVERMMSHSPYGSDVAYFDYGPGCCDYRINTDYSTYYDDWTYVTYTSQATTGVNKMEIFFNAQSAISNNNGDDISGVTGFYIGAATTGSSFHPGSVDEFRMSSVVRSDEWINMSYELMKNQASLVSFGEEEQTTDKGGAISMVVGDVPFYTVTPNPNDYTNTSCLGDMRDESCEVTWTVNATGQLGSVWEFFVYANSTTFGNVSGESIRINVTIGNAPPLTPELIYPVNASSFAIFTEFNWSNATDPTGDAVSYILEVSNVSDFSSLVYSNGSIPETDDPTGDTPSGITDEGTYFWRVRATDLKSNSSWSEVRTFYFDQTPPNVTLVLPEDGAVNTTTNTMDFSYNVSDLSDVLDCSLIVNGVVNVTDDSITKDTLQMLTTTLANGLYNWSVNCTDSAGLVGASDVRALNVSVANNPPRAYEIECEEDLSGSFSECTSAIFGDNVTRFRVRCYDAEGNATSAVFNLTNIPDGYTYFYNSTNESSGDYWILDIGGVIINDSGNFTIKATCNDGEGFSSSNSTNWLVPWGTPTITLINPSSSVYVMQNLFFDFNVSVGCNGGECGNVNATLDPAGWWGDGWGRRKTINFTGVGSLTDFPIYLNVSYDSDMQDDYDDLRFLNGSCTGDHTQLLDYEIENYTTGESVHVWVRIPNVYSGINQICMYYGNSDASNGENATGVWDSSYLAVYHLSDDPTGTVYDSTSNAYHLTSSGGMTSTDLVSGPVAGAIDFDGGDDKLQSMSFDWTSNGPVTLELWNYVATGDVQNSGAVTFSVEGANERFGNHFPYSNNNAYWDYGTCCSDGRVYSSYASYLDQWTYIVGRSEGVGGSAQDLLTNMNTLASKGSSDGPSTTLNDFRIGNQNDAIWHDGMIDEVRISNVFRSTDWVNQTYQMMANQNSYVDFGDEEKGKSGTIPMTIGEEPFYTISQNPRDHINTTCLADVKPGASCDVSWRVNATGPVNSVWEFFVISNTTSYTSWFSSGNESKRVNVTIVNQLAPSVPQLNAPANASAFPVVREFNWTNSTDVNGGAIYYMIEISNVSNFSTTVYSNYSIPERSNPTGITPTLPDVGTYYWRVRATDLIANSSWSETWIFYYDLSAPDIEFINQTGEDDEIIDEDHPLDEGENLTLYVEVDDINVDSVWIVVWDTVKGGVEKARLFFTYVGGFLWKAVVPTDYSWDNLIYDYTIYANDTLGSQDEYDGNFTMLHGDITLDLTPNPVSAVTSVSAYGSLNLTNGSILGNHPINLWLDGSLLLLGNLTPDGEYDNYLEFNDTEDSDFDEGRYYHTFTDGPSLKLVSGNTSGNFTKVLDAGARVEWGNVIWLSSGQACSAVVTFQDGDVNGYSQTGDTYVDSGSASSNFGSSDGLLVDGSPDDERGLIKFGSIFGTGFNQVPLGSTIIAANITVEISDPGNIVNVYEVLENWTEGEATYGNRLTGVAWGDGDGCGGPPSRAAVAESSFTPGSARDYTFDITNAVSRWSDGTSNNYGVVLDLATSNGINIRSSEYSTQGERPRLTVGYSSDDCTGLQVYVRTSNDKSSWSDWQEVSNGGGVNDGNFASRYLEYRVELTSTNASFSPVLQEIVINYTAVVTNASGDYRYNFTNPSAYADYPMVAESGLRTIIMNASANLSVQTGVAPNVFLLDPFDGQWFSYGNLTFIYNVTDINDDMVSSVLIINNAINATNSSEILNGENNTFLANFSSGQFNWTVNVTDDSGFTSTASPWSFYVDLEDPNVSLVFPPNGSSYLTNELFLSFNVTDNLDSVLVCDVHLGEDIIHDDVPANNSEITNLSSGILSSGDYEWYVDCVDEAGRVDVSQTYVFEINDTPPEVSLVAPFEGYIDNNGNISFVFNASDNSGFKNCSLLINGTYYAFNQTAIANGGNTTINATGLSEGVHNWTVECFDLSDNVARPDARNFSVDLYAPVVGLNSPEHYGNLSYADVEFNFTANDTFDTLLDCNLTIDNVVRDTLTALSGVETGSFIENLIDGERAWYVTCWDDAGNSNLSSLRRVSIFEPPTIELNTPNETSFDTNEFNLTYTPSDNTNLSICDLYIDGIIEANDTDVPNGVEQNFSVSEIPAGPHTWYVNCTDIYNITNVSEVRMFSVDTLGPNITLHYPDGHEIGTDNVTFNFTAVDETDTSFFCNLTVDSTVEVADLLVSNGTVTNVNVSDVTDGFHIWYVNCTDSANNIGSSAIFNFTKSTPPQVSLILPEDGHWFNDLPFNLTYLPSDDEGFLGAELHLNGQFNRTNSTEVSEFVQNDFVISDIEEGVYNWTVRVTDIRGLNSTASPNRTFYLDSTPPQLVLNYPESSDNLSTNNVTFNFTVSDNLDSLLECMLYLDGEVEYSGNSTTGSNKIHYALVGDGLHFWNVTCIDEADNVNVSEMFNFTIEAPPNVTLVSPEDGAYFNYTDPVFVYLPEDPIGITNCSIYIDGVYNDSDTVVQANENNNFTVSGISEGYHNWTIECVDAIPDYNIFRTLPWDFLVDRNPPLIELNLPSDGGNVLGQTDFNFSVSDNFDGELDCGIYIDGALNVSVSVSNGSSTTQIISGLSLGNHFWNVSCVDNASNLNWSDTWSFNVTYSDLYVNDSSIVFNKSNPRENETVQINATVYNLASVDVYNVTVSFYDGHPSEGGIQIGGNQTIDFLAGLSEEVATVEWAADLGTSLIFVFVDPPTESNGSIVEWDEQNNEANKSITVGAWHFLVGDIDSLSEFVLTEGTTNSSVKRWLAVNYEGGNLYAADSDSIISWTSLQAIGKDTSDIDEFDDFGEIDVALNMTGFEDSVSVLYTNGTDVLDTDSYIIFKDSVDAVPVTNSTNNTNFQTGILWDTSDDVADGGYSLEDSEDLLFVSSIQKDLSGAYGNYDYEIRVPATLRSYKSGGVREVVFYTELR